MNGEAKPRFALFEWVLARLLRRRGSDPLLTQRAVAGPVPWVIAIMTALTVIAAAGGIALGGVASTARAELEGGATFQVAAASQARSEAQAKKLIDALTDAPGVRSTRRLDAAERAELLAPWLGAVAKSADADLLVIPELIEVRLSGPADAEALGSLRAVARSVAPDAALSADSSWLKPVGEAIRALQWLAVALVALLAMATAAAILLASRSALAANRETIEIMHLLGAADRQIARMFQRAAALGAAAGGTAGFAVAEATVVALSGRFAALGPRNTAAGLGALDWLALVMIPVAVAALAALTARVTVLATLRRMP